MENSKLAATFAIAAHAGQVRKYSGLPYFTHCASVANLVRHFGGNDTLIAVAYLHDVLEDCEHITSVDLRQVFNSDIVDRVKYLTKHEDVDYTAQLLEADEFTQFVKLCDIMDNCKDSPDIDYVKSKVKQISGFQHSVFKEYVIKFLETRLTTLRSLR
jgi:(p)ppGpp synthase/HD superfamily hydrolase